jgi:signal transduction histidine kinase
MAYAVARSPRRVRSSVSRSDLIPEIGISTATVLAMTVIHWVAIPYMGAKPPLVLFTATAAAITFWRGLGPGLVTSMLGSVVGSSLFISPISGLGALKGNVPFETLVLFSGSLFTCWLIFRLKADNEDNQVVEVRRTDALAFVAHELRNPLFNIQMAASMLEREPSEKTRQATRLIVSSATRLGNVIDDLADVIRLQANAIAITPTDLCLQDVIVASAEAAQPSIQQRKQRLEVDAPLNPPLLIKGDAVRLQQVFGNLLSNACNYSPEGADIAIACREENGRAVIVVKDTGVGIKRDMLERIFDPFVRGNGSGADGLGIGLTLVRNLVAQHGGHITAHSDGIGRGSAFVVDLPLLPPAYLAHRTDQQNAAQPTVH